MPATVYTHKKSETPPVQGSLTGGMGSPTLGKKARASSKRIWGGTNGLSVMLPTSLIVSCHCYLVKRAVEVYAFILQIAGFVALGLYGVSQLQRQDPRGITILALLACGIVLTLPYAWVHHRRSRNTQRFLAGKPFRPHTFHASATAEYKHAPERVWELIRPAQVAVLIEGAAQAFKVPETPDGEGERQCFISEDGQVSCIEVVKEVPFRSAVTRSICSSLQPSVQTTYILEPSTTGCKLTRETVVESPVTVPFAQQQAFRGHNESFVEKVGHLLDRPSMRDAPTNSSGG